MERNRASVIAETYRRWEQRDFTPLIPPFKVRKKVTRANAKARTNSTKGKSKR
jgi:hypothetical protein